MKKKNWKIFFLGILLTTSSLNPECNWILWFGSNPLLLFRKSSKNCLKNALKSTLAMWNIAKVISSFNKSCDFCIKTSIKTDRKWAMSDSVKIGWKKKGFFFIWLIFFSRKKKKYSPCDRASIFHSKLLKSVNFVWTRQYQAVKMIAQMRLKLPKNGFYVELDLNGVLVIGPQ